MYKLSPEQLLEHLEAFYDEEHDTVHLKCKSNLVLSTDKNLVQDSKENIMFYSNYHRNKKIYSNTGIFDDSLSVEENVQNAIMVHQDNMRRLMEENKQLNELLAKINSSSSH